MISIQVIFAVASMSLLIIAITTPTCNMTASTVNAGCHSKFLNRNQKYTTIVAINNSNMTPVLLKNMLHKPCLFLS